MTAIYVALGGVLSAVINLAANPNFGVNQFTLAFSAGIGWPALAAGFSAGKRIGEIDEETAKVEQTAKNLETMKDSRLTEIENYYKSNREQSKKTIEVVKQAFEKELDDLRSFYEQKLASMGR